MSEPFDPWPARRDAVVRLVEARAGGATLRQAAEAAGVHPGTACRWRLRSPVVAAALRMAVDAARERRRLTRATRPWVRWHPSCPACGGAVEVRQDREGSGRLLAVRQPAGVPMEKLAAAAPGRLPGVRRAALLVALPQERQLPGVRNPDPRRPGRPEADAEPLSAAAADPAGRGAAG